MGLYGLVWGVALKLIDYIDNRKYIEGVVNLGEIYL